MEHWDAISGETIEYLMDNIPKLSNRRTKAYRMLRDAIDARVGNRPSYEVQSELEHLASRGKINRKYAKEILLSMEGKVHDDAWGANYQIIGAIAESCIKEKRDFNSEEIKEIKWRLRLIDFRWIAGGVGSTSPFLPKEN